MNTRIQGEQPVTEMVTGLDLVVMQLELARGTDARIPQAGISVRGPAIECRLYAENPAKMFMPSPGPLDVFALPEGMEHVRIDSGRSAERRVGTEGVSTCRSRWQTDS